MESEVVWIIGNLIIIYHWKICLYNLMHHYKEAGTQHFWCNTLMETVRQLCARKPSPTSWYLYAYLNYTQQGWSNRQLKLPWLYPYKYLIFSFDLSLLISSWPVLWPQTQYMLKHLTFSLHLYGQAWNAFFFRREYHASKIELLECLHS